jgi:energy-converting hydrogenase Eha subunit A
MKNTHDPSDEEILTAVLRLPTRKRGRPISKSWSPVTNPAAATFVLFS